MSNTRIYIVQDNSNDDAEAKLVEATTPAQAIGHIVRSRYTAAVASQLELVELVKSGVEVEKAGGHD